MNDNILWASDMRKVKNEWIFSSHGMCSWSKIKHCLFILAPSVTFQQKRILSTAYVFVVLGTQSMKSWCYSLESNHLHKSKNKVKEWEQPVHQGLSNEWHRVRFRRAAFYFNPVLKAVMHCIPFSFKREETVVEGSLKKYGILLVDH